MNTDIMDAIIRSSGESVQQPQYEEVDEEPVTIEEEVADIAAHTDFEDLKPEKKEYDIDGYEDPYPQKKHKSAEAEMQDRLLSIPLRPKNAPWGSLWVIRTAFIEQISLLNITKSEQRGLLRQWSDIQVMAEGDGNADIIESEQEEFVLKIVSYKSRSDNPEKGIRERTAHITQKTIADQTIQMPKQESQKSGFLNTILGRKSQ